MTRTIRISSLAVVAAAALQTVIGIDRQRSAIQQSSEREISPHPRHVTELRTRRMVSEPGGPARAAHPITQGGTTGGNGEPGPHRRSHAARV